MEEKRKKHISPVILMLLMLLVFVFLLICGMGLPMLFLPKPPPPAPTPVAATTPATGISIAGIKIPVYTEGEDFPIAIIHAKKATSKGIIFNMTGVKIEFYEGKKLVKRILAASGSWNQQTKKLTLIKVTVLRFDTNSKVTDTIIAPKIIMILDKKTPTMSIDARK